MTFLYFRNWAKQLCSKSAWVPLVWAIIGQLVLVQPLTKAEAQVPPPPITSSGLNTQVSAPVVLPGGETQHNITGGTRPGSGANLFHSFGEFGVPTDNLANFLNDSALPTSNILSRVTGGNPSNILGTIQTEGFGNANLFLMNPAGLVFGPDAALNVGGATHFTTADYLKLADGVQFTALPSAQDAVLSIAPVTAFGFLFANPAPISVEGSTLSVEEGQTLSLVGGDITIGSGLNAPGGKVALASVASPGEVLADSYGSGPNINGESFDDMGTIALGEGTTLDVSGDAAGTVVIRGGQLMMTGAVISADTVNQNGAPVAIDIDVTEEASITAVNVTALTARTTGTGNAGEIRVSSGGDMNLSGAGLFRTQFAMIDTHTSGPGNGGDVSLSSQGDMTVTGDPTGRSRLFLADTGTDGFDTGTGGDLSITAKNFVSFVAPISTGNFASSRIRRSSGAGPAGNVAISVDGKIDLTLSPIITDSFDIRSNLGKGSGDVTLSGQEMNFNRSNISTSGGSRAGNLTINTDTLTVSSSQFQTLTRDEGGGTVTITGRIIELLGSEIVSTTRENADAGDITIIATERLSLSNVDPFSPSPVINRPSAIASNSVGDSGAEISGSPGNITISTPLLVLDGGSKINTATGSSGTGGNVSIDGKEILISGQTTLTDQSDIVNFGQFPSSGIFTSSLGGFCAGPCGDAGNVNIGTESVVLGKGGQINSGTITEGRGGEIIVNAMDNISIAGTLDDGTPGGVFSQTTGTDPGSGAGGTIALTSGQSFTLSDGATVSASSSGPANAGNINITAANTILLDGASITTEAAEASGGNIKLTAEELIRLNDSIIASSVQGSATTVGGDISLDPEFIILQNSQILAKALAGQGGNISLIADNAVLVDSFSVLDASSALGISGSVNIQAPTKFLNGAIVPLENQPVNVAELYGARCAAGQGGHFSTFVDSKTDSLSPTPGSFLASPLLFSSAQAPAVADTSAGRRNPVMLTALVSSLVLGHAGDPMTGCP